MDIYINEDIKRDKVQLCLAKALNLKSIDTVKNYRLQKLIG